MHVDQEGPVGEEGGESEMEKVFDPVVHAEVAPLAAPFTPPAPAAGAAGREAAGSAADALSLSSMDSE